MKAVNFTQLDIKQVEKMTYCKVSQIAMMAPLTGVNDADKVRVTKKKIRFFSVTWKNWEYQNALTQ